MSKESGISAIMAMFDESSSTLPPVCQQNTNTAARSNWVGSLCLRVDELRDFLSSNRVNPSHEEAFIMVGRSNWFTEHPVTCTCQRCRPSGTGYTPERAVPHAKDCKCEPCESFRKLLNMPISTEDTSEDNE